MKDVSRGISVSFKKQDRIYADMLSAVSAFYQSKGDEERGNVSKIIVELIKQNVPRMLDEIRHRYNVDPLEIYQTYRANRVTLKEFFDERVTKERPSSKFIESVLDETYDNEQ